MKAIVVKPGEKDSIHMRDMPDPKMKPDQVAVKMLRVGLCGTDAEINHGLYGKPPDGDEFLILGHENLGVVEQVGKKVKGWKAGRPRRLDRPPALRQVPAVQGRRERHVQQRPVHRARHHAPPRLHGAVLRRVADVPEQDPEGDPRLRGAARADVGRAEGHRPHVPAAAAPEGLEAEVRDGARRRADRPARGGRPPRPRPAHGGRRPRRPDRLPRADRQGGSAPSTCASPTRRCPTCRRKPAFPTSSSRRPASRASSSTRWRSSGPTACSACCRSPAATR